MTVEQPPIDACCPECGADAGYNPRHQLSALGYHDDEQTYDCEACGHTWTHGVPDGEYDGPLATDLECGACGEMGLVHRLHPMAATNDDLDDDGTRPGTVVQMKCPSCYYVWRFSRVADARGIVHLGYPETTGRIDAECEPYGYESGAAMEGDDGG